MLLANRIYASSAQSVDLIAIGRLQGSEHRDITRLQFVRRMRGQATQDDVVSKAKLKHFHRFVTSETITDQDTWLSVSSLSGLWIKHARKLL